MVSLVEPRGPGVTPFLLTETHGILARPENEPIASSLTHGWCSVLASIQREQPYEASYDACRDHLIILHLDGQAQVDRWVGPSRESRLISPGGLFMVPCDMNFRVRLNDPLTTMHFYLRDCIVREVAAELGFADPGRVELLPRIGETDPLIERLLLSVRDELLFGASDSQTYVDQIARMTAARLIRGHSATSARAVEHVAKTGDDQRKVSQVAEFVQSNLHRSIRLDDMAGVLGISVTQLMVLFRRVLGQSPHRFVINLRIVRARHLLATSLMPACEIALACGFSHQEHMIRLFRREIGLTPAAYRRSIS